MFNNLRILIRHVTNSSSLQTVWKCG